MTTKIFRKHNWMAPGFGLAMTALFLCPALLLAQTPDLEVCGEYKAFSLLSLQPAEGAGVITYQWYENDAPIPSSNAASICITEGRPAGTYAYVRKASSDACPDEVASNTYTVKVNTLPSLTISPISAHTTPNVGVTLTATASQCNGCTYLWSTGETTSSIVAGASNADVVYYSCTVTPDEGCTATTAAATVTVVEPPPGATPPVTLCPSCCWDDATATWVYCFVTTNAYPFENTTNSGVEWSGAGTLYFSDAVSDRNGKGNTSAIPSTGTSAVQLCKDLGEGWYLPAYEELLNMTTTRADMLLNGLPGFPILTLTGVPPEDSWHWSSTESYNPLPGRGRYQMNNPTNYPERAMTVNPGGQLTYPIKTKTLYYFRCAWQP